MDILLEELSKDISMINHLSLKDFKPNKENLMQIISFQQPTLVLKSLVAMRKLSINIKTER